jgi:hypothetical protein
MLTLLAQFLNRELQLLMASQERLVRLHHYTNERQMIVHNYCQRSPNNKASHVNMVEGSTSYLKRRERSKPGFECIIL